MEKRELTAGGLRGELPFDAPPAWQQVLDVGICALSEAGIREAELDAWYLFSDSFHMDRVHFLMDRNRTMYQGTLEKGWPLFAGRIRLRASRVPLQYILGSQEFMGLSFQVNEHVLIPRQDTETLVEEILKDVPERDIKILDLCTGSGCIGLSLAVLGKYKSVTAADISREALAVASRNAKSLFLIQKEVIRSQARIVSDDPWRMEFSVRTGMTEETREERYFTLAESDLFSEISDGSFDIIVSNPPYIPTAIVDSLEPEVKDHEPRLALDGTEDGLYFYRRLASECGKHLKPGGRLYFEIGHDQGEAVKHLLLEQGYREVETVKDAPGMDRVIKARL